MSELVTSIQIPELVNKLREGEYLVPRFQREFVWSTADVISLLHSIIDSRPIGMMTLWEQPDNSGLDLEHVSLPDSPADLDESNLIYFGDNADRTNKAFAILDGRQRSTAIAMAFGGLRATDARRRHAGKFFLNVTADEAIDRIVFKKISEIEAQGLDTLAHCIAAGLFPFEMDLTSSETIKKQWIKYSRDLMDDQYYKDGNLPPRDELDRRAEILDNAINGITETSLAVYVVPRKYDLGTICEIFETLNTTGTKVSTVDLIHSWLYADTTDDAGGPTLLREWIRELGQRPGALGWSDPEDRPELIAQFVTATYLAEQNPSPPRKVGGKQSPVASVKSGDLLATPTEHWKEVISKTDELASYIGDFQTCVARNKFAMKSCPYPVSAAVYVGLRWTNKVDGREWQVDAIDALYRAFFWRNCLTSRYDQGFLTKMATDLKLLSDLLDGYAAAANFGDWATAATFMLDENVAPAPSRSSLTASLLDAKPAGAFGKALVLPLLTRPGFDILEPMKSIVLGKSSEPVEVHHLYPKAWVRDNFVTAQLEAWRGDGRGTVECVANLTPMLRSSNAKWKAKAPGKALSDSGVTPTTHGQVLHAHYLSEPVYGELINQAAGLPVFWEERATSIADDLLGRTAIQG